MVEKDKKDEDSSKGPEQEFLKANKTPISQFGAKKKMKIARTVRKAYMTLVETMIAISLLSMVLMVVLAFFASYPTSLN